MLLAVMVKFEKFALRGQKSDIWKNVHFQDRGGHLKKSEFPG